MTFISKIAVSAATLMVATVSVAAENEKHFHGPYVGADAGVTDSGEFYYAALAGIRTQTENNLVLGAEATFGDYAVSESYFIGATPVTASVDYTWSVVGYVGYAFGSTKRSLVKVGAGYNAIHAKASAAGVTVTDTVDDVRAFVGYERAFENNWHLRVSLDYLTIEGSDGGQATAGIAYQF